MDNVFVINAGSSSLKYQLIDMAAETVLISGNCERIGEEEGRIIYKRNGDKKVFNVRMPNHKAALNQLMKLLCEGETKVIGSMDDIVAVGHRIAMGFTPTVPITDEVIHAIEGTKTVAPLHIPAMLTGIYAAQDIFGSDKLNVAAYDTSFHLTMPDKAYMYAIPYEYYEKYGLRRYGYHGTSHRYVSLRAAQLLGRKPEDLKIISCHLGNGSSIAAIEGGKSIDTSMGYTPLAGVMMGTRCGDIDPSLLHHIAKIDNLSIDEVYNLLNKKSGVLGVSGVSNDDRDVLEAAENGNKRAALACRMLRYQIKKYIGAYTAALGGLDAVIFTAGIGERSPELRAEVCENLEYLGIKINPEKNWSKAHSTEWEISTEDSRVKVWVIPTNEELMIARDAYQIYLDLKKR